MQVKVRFINTLLDSVPPSRPQAGLAGAQRKTDRSQVVLSRS